jgi:hypothetical protein
MATVPRKAAKFAMNRKVTRADGEMAGKHILGCKNTPPNDDSWHSQRPAVENSSV